MTGTPDTRLQADIRDLKEEIKGLRRDLHEQDKGLAVLETKFGLVAAKISAFVALIISVVTAAISRVFF